MNKKTILLAITGLAALAAVTAALLVDWIPHKPVLQEAAPIPRESPDLIRFESGAPQLAAIKVEPATRMALPVAEPLHGRIAVDEDFAARVSAPIAGRVVELRAQVGDAVRRGSLLAVIDAPDLGAAQADLHKARADEEQKDLAARRARELAEGGVLARKDLEAAEAVLTQAKAETQRARLRVANLDPGNTARSGQMGQRLVLGAPVGGVVIDRHINPGAEVRPDLADPLFVVADPARLQVIIDLPEQYLSRVNIGLPVTLTVDAWPEETFKGTVVRITPTVDPGTRRIQVRCRIDNSGLRLKPEMYAKVTLVNRDGAAAVRVPNSALVTQGIYSSVFVEEAGGTFRKRKVELAVQDREYSYVASGLNDGERVVTRGAILLDSQLAQAQ